MKALISLCVVLVLAGCADTHQLIRGDTSTTKLTLTDSVFISVPQDGAYGADVYSGSGQSTTQILFSAFAKRTRFATSGRSSQDFAAALQSARQADCQYLVFPTILHWEDRATEWSSIPDRVEVKVEVLDARTESVIASAVIQGKSGLATLGGDHPQDLLPEPIEEFVSSLY